MKYNIDQIDQNLKEITVICQQVCANTNGIRLTVSPANEELMTVTDLTHVLDVGEEYSFFYNDEAKALEDQKTLCTYLRVRGLSVAKVTKQQPISIKSQ